MGILDIFFGSTDPQTLRQQLAGGDLKAKASAATKLGQMRDLEAVPLLVRAIIDEMRQRMDLANDYQKEIDRTGGWTPVGGTEAVKKRRAEIESVALARKAHDALVAIGIPALGLALEELRSLPASTKKWNAMSRSGLVQAIEEVFKSIGGPEGENALNEFRGVMKGSSPRGKGVR